MGAQRHQSRCKDCDYIWYQREKTEVCPKCKGANVAYSSGLGRRLAMVLGLAVVIAGGIFGFVYFRQDHEERSPSVAEQTPATSNERAKPGEVEKAEDLEGADPGLETGSLEGTNTQAPAASLTAERTWTARDGRTLQATLLRLKMVEGKYVGVFKKPGGETFEYKIGNFAKADVELVKEIVGSQK